MCGGGISGQCVTSLGFLTPGNVYLFIFFPSLSLTVRQLYNIVSVFKFTKNNATRSFFESSGLGFFSVSRDNAYDAYTISRLTLSRDRNEK